MFKGLGSLMNVGSLLKQAQLLGGKLGAMSEELKACRVEGTSGGGLVTVEANGVSEILRCRIDESLLADREMLEDLLPAAINAALAKSKEAHMKAMQAMAGDMDVPGLNDMLSQLAGGGPGEPPAS